MKPSKDDILKKRAEKIALPLTETPSDKAQQNGFIVFKLCDETYAVEQGFVSEVLKNPKIYHIPCCPAFIKGIIYNRGMIIPVYDLKILLDLKDKKPPETQAVILLSNEDDTISVLVDKIVSIQPFDIDESSLNYPSQADVQITFVKGILNGNITVISAEALLNDESLVVDDRI